jgi:fructose-bisphosphate aldolase class 1
MITIKLDDETETYLSEILRQEQTTTEELVKNLLRNHLINLKKNQTVLERMVGYPQELLTGAEDLSDRDVRKKIIAEQIQKNISN